MLSPHWSANPFAYSCVLTLHTSYIVVQTKSDNDVILGVQLLSVNINLYTLLDLTRIDRILADRINIQVI